MKRPFVVCHILSTLDGKISGGFMGLPEAAGARTEYGNLREFYKCDSILYGTTTMVESYGLARNLPKVDTQFPREDFIVYHDKKNYIVSLDADGVLAFSSNTLTRSGKTNAHIIEILTEKVSDNYLAYLRALQISYIFAGETQLDFALALEKLSEKFGIKRLMLAGGGKINQSLLDEGLIDELSLVVAPVSENDKNAVALFEAFDRNNIARPVSYQLIEVNPIDGGGLWLRYTPNNRKK